MFAKKQTVRQVITVSRAQAIELLQKHRSEGRGQIFSVSFIKRTTGEQRDMLCRFKVRKHLKGGSQKYNPEDVALQTVFDVQKREYRNINLLELLTLRIGGIDYRVAR